MTSQEFIVLYNHYFVKYGKYVCTDRHIQKDLVQDCIFKILKNYEKLQFDNEIQIRQFIFKTVKSKYFDYIRGKKYNRRFELIDSLDFEYKSLIYKENLVFLLNTLPDIYKDCLHKRIEGYSCDDIAELENINPCTVRTRIKKAKRLLNEKILTNNLTYKDL